MKKIPFKRLLALGLVGTLSFTLSACGKPDYNTYAPYGSIDGNYATNGSTTLTNKQLYDMLRPSSYSVFYNEIETILLDSYVKVIDFNNDEDKEEMFEYLNKLIFDTDDVEDIYKLTADKEALDLQLKQLADSMYSSGIVFDTDDIVITETKVTYPKELFDYFKLNLAKERFGTAKLTELVDKEEIADTSEGAKEGAMIDNPNFISDKDIESYYNNTYIKEQDFNAIIIGFNSLNDYERVVRESGFNITVEGSEFPQYINLYNKAFSYKKELPWAPADSAETKMEKLLENTIVNSEVLANYNSSLATFINNMEAGTYTTTCKEFGDKYYMVFKINEYTDTKWKDLTEEDFQIIGKDKEELTAEIKEEIFDTKMTSSFINSQITEMVNELIEDNKIEIYDPVFALTFQTKFSDYEYTTKTLDSETAVAKIDGTEIKVDTFFETVAKYFGAPAAFDYFTNTAVANSSYMDKLTDEDLEAAQDSFDAEIKNFKDNTYASSGITSEFTEEQFLMMTLGYDNEDDALKYYYEPQQAYQYVTSNHNDNYFELLSLIGQNNYNNFFSLDINHALLYVDYDLDGSMDNPKDFLLELEKDSPELVDDFKQTIVNIYAAIYNEVNFLQLGAEEGLKYMVKAYNENRKLVAPENAEWETFYEVKVSEGKNFNILLKVEDLGVVDTSNASNYVSDFSDHVRDMYEDLKQQTRDDLGYEADDEDDKTLLSEFEDFLDQDHLEEITTATDFDDICMSSFGFHMLLSTKGSIPTSAVFQSSSDYKQNIGDEFKIYESIDIELNDISVNVNAYSDTAYPSINQLQIYVAQKDTDDGITDLKSTTETIINNFYSTFNSRFTDNTFRNYYLYKELNMNIVFANSTIEVETWFDINKDILDNYADTTVGSGHMYAGMWELVDKLFTETE